MYPGKTKMQIRLISAKVPRNKTVVSNLPVLVGRNPTAQVHLKDAGVGQFQCIIEQDGGMVGVRDIWGGPGIFVNGVQVRNSCLISGDRLVVGKTEFVVQYNQ